MTGKTTRITLACFDGEYEFQLSLGGIVAIEEKAGLGIGAIYARILRGRFEGSDGETFGVATESEFSAGMLFEVVRQGLIFGNKGRSDGSEFGVTPLKAGFLIQHYLSPDQGKNLKPAWDLAAAILHATIEGVDVEDEPEAPDAEAA